MTAVSFRPTAPEDLPALAGFFAERFGHAWTPKEWSWKYRAFPGEARSWVAVDAGGEILAHAGALRLPARLRGEETGIWTLVDWAGTSRRRGLRPPLVDLGRRVLADLPRQGDAPWIFGFPSERHFRLGERVFGYRPLAAFTELAGEIPQGVGMPLGIPLDTGDSAGDWAERVWEACRIDGVRRSAAFLNWRYYARPHRYYRFYPLSFPGGEGLAVFAFVGEEAWAAELWLPPGTDWYPHLLAVAADLRAAGLRRWRFWPPPPGLGLDEVLAALGLRAMGERRFIGCRGGTGGTDPTADPVEAARGFHYAMGDYDLA